MRDVDGTERIVRYGRDLEIAACGISLAALAHFGRETKGTDVVHYHFPWPSVDFVHPVWRVSTPSVVTYHSDIVRQRRLLSIYRPMMTRFLRGQSTIVSTSPNYVRSSPVLDSHRDQVEVIPLVLATGCPVHASAYCRAGGGPLESTVCREIAAAGVENVLLAGRVTDVEKLALYRPCRAAVVLSCERSEAYRMTLVEAAMYGKPRISTELNMGTSFINHHGETGFVTSPESPHELGEANQRLIEVSELAERMGRSARRRCDSVLSG